MTRVIEPPTVVLETYAVDPASIEVLPGGHINSSFSVRRLDGAACVLQRVNPIFPPKVNDDIDAVTAWLAAKGLAAPRLLRDEQDRHHVVIDGEVWRLMTRIEGETHQTIRTNQEAREAGRALGEFHDALIDFEHELANHRSGVHDLKGHLAKLRGALDEHRAHHAFGDIEAVAEQILALAEKCAIRLDRPRRLVHGDPKISNVIFDRDRAVCWIDLDTISRMPLAIEIGDALRSWCNPAGEDAPDARFSFARFEAAIEGYSSATGDWLTDDEWKDVPETTLAIAVELAARFAADALYENYFGWDRERFASASHHNAARAEAQLALAIDIERQLDRMRDALMTRM